MVPTRGELVSPVRPSATTPPAASRCCESLCFSHSQTMRMRRTAKSQLRPAYHHFIQSTIPLSYL